MRTDPSKVFLVTITMLMAGFQTSPAEEASAPASEAPQVGELYQRTIDRVTEFCPDLAGLF